MTCDNPKIQKNNTPILDRGEEVFREIRIRKGECQKYVFFPQENGIFERKFILEAGSVFRGAAIALGANMVLKMSVIIEGSETEASLNLLGLAQKGDVIELDGIGNVAFGCQDVKLRVDQTSILLGTGARVRGRPVLQVATDSIEGGHSCRIHRISGETLFYLQSHGIDVSSAEAMLLEGEIRRCTDLLEERGEEMKEHVLRRVLDSSHNDI